MKSIKVILIISAIAAMLAGCSDTSPIAPTNIFPSQSTAQEMILPTSTLTSTSTPMPTVSRLESEARVEELLANNEGCMLPCVWGIVPGESLYSDARHFFESLGWKGSETYGFYETGKDIQSYSIVLNVGVYTSNDVVEKVHIAIGGKDFLRKVKYFSFENVFKLHGKPSEILVFIGISPGILEPDRTSFDLLLYYKTENTLIEYVGTAVRHADSYRICPSQPNAESLAVDPLSGNVSIYTGVANRGDTPQELVRPFWVLPDYYISTEKAFGIGVDDFYKMTSQNNGNVCFDSPLLAWQRE